LVDHWFHRGFGERVKKEKSMKGMLKSSTGNRRNRRNLPKLKKYALSLMRRVAIADARLSKYYIES